MSEEKPAFGFKKGEVIKTFVLHRSWPLNKSFNSLKSSPECRKEEPKNFKELTEKFEQLVKNFKEAKDEAKDKKFHEIITFLNENRFYPSSLGF